MLYILAVADRGLISHAQAFQTRKAAAKGLVRYLRKSEGYKGADDMDSAQRWLDEHDERVNVEIIEQAGDLPRGNCVAALRRIYDILYLDLKGGREFYNQEKQWTPDTLSAVAEVVTSFLDKPPAKVVDEEEGDDELTPMDRAGFVQRIEHVSPYDEGLDADGNMVSPSDFVTDLLTDIRHYCDARNVDFAACDRLAYRHYAAERHDRSRQGHRIKVNRNRR